jgi:hypothetical protein
MAAGISATGTAAAVAAAAAALADFLAAGFLVETLGINYVLVCDWIPIASGQRAEKISPHWTGCAGKSSNWIYRPIGILSQIGKGNIAVNGLTLTQKRRTVNFEIFLCAFDLVYSAALRQVNAGSGLDDRLLFLDGFFF